MTPIPNTFGVSAYCRQIVEIPRDEFLIPGDLYFCAGAGSNVLWTEDFDGVLVRSADKDIEILFQGEDAACIRIGAGTTWHHAVQASLERGWYGLENLALIPGTVGAAVVQNIGAYGVEIKDRLLSARVLNLETGIFSDFSNEECGFGYRDSLFKREEKYLVVAANLALSRKHVPTLNYPDLRDRFSNKVPTAGEVFEAVCEIRRRKLPDPAVVGNGGSFFKNPVVQQAPPGYWGPLYTTKSDGIKLSAAWMIEAAGWKGKTMGRAGISPGHALVLINMGGAEGVEIARLAAAVRRSVIELFGVELENEVVVMGKRGRLPLKSFE